MNPRKSTTTNKSLEHEDMRDFTGNKPYTYTCLLLLGMTGIGKLTAVDAICNTDGNNLEHIDCCMYKSMADIKSKYHETVKSVVVRPIFKPMANTDYVLEGQAEAADGCSLRSEGSLPAKAKVFLIHNFDYLLKCSINEDSSPEKLSKLYSNFARHPDFHSLLKANIICLKYLILLYREI